MAKRQRTTRRPARQPKRETNWLLIGGIVLAGVAVIALLALALREPAAAAGLADFCAENPENCIVNGSDDAPVTIVEVSDYGCIHCRNFNLETAGLLEDLYVTPGDVRWITLPFALSTTTVPAASAALCAEEQGLFPEFHRRMFENQPASGVPADHTAVAQSVGLDMTAFNSCVDSNRYDSTVSANVRAANLAGVNATPTFFINGKMVEGNRPLPTFQQEINAAKETANAN